jgi:hypothetical protein
MAIDTLDLGNGRTRHEVPITGRVGVLRCGQKDLPAGEGRAVTIAICVQCGATKFGALTPCKECAYMPATERDVIYSMALSDHYMDAAKLQYRQVL